jgi:hypothetical protein
VKQQEKRAKCTLLSDQEDSYNPARTPPSFGASSGPQKPIEADHRTQERHRLKCLVSRDNRRRLPLIPRPRRRIPVAALQRFSTSPQPCAALPRMMLPLEHSRQPRISGGECSDGVMGAYHAAVLMLATPGCSHGPALQGSQTARRTKSIRPSRA